MLHSASRFSKKALQSANQDRNFDHVVSYKLCIGAKKQEASETATLLITN